MHTIHIFKQYISQKLSHRFKVGSSGFTLVELMVVLSIMSLLSSIIFASTQYARAKAVDTAQVNTVKQINTAIQAKMLATGGSAPANPLDGQSGCGTGTACVAYSSGTDAGAIPGDGKNAFNEVMQQLVNEGYLSSIPVIPNKNSSIGYYNFGPNNPVGAVVFGSQKLATPTYAGPVNTCRLLIGTTAQQQQQNQSMNIPVTPTEIVKNPLVSVAHAMVPPSGPTIEEQFPRIGPNERVQMLTFAAQYEQMCYDGGTQSCNDGDLGDEDEQFPSCSSEYANTSYCLCAPY
ncbi:MAG TPA: type II secretion system protein [Candidatus Paceibacterota bacterium]|nr:type II secretion system protein [Candidatus Paceibacterota bacterium]